MSIVEYTAALGRFKEAPASSRPEKPSPLGLDYVLKNIPLYPSQILLGVAQNVAVTNERPLPVTIDLHHSMDDSPVLVTGTRDCGKSNILHSMALQVVWKGYDNVDVSVVTTRPEEWKFISHVWGENNLQKIGGPALRTFIREQNAWARENQYLRTPKLRMVIIQNLNACKNQLKQYRGILDLQDLLTYGSKGGVTVVASSEVDALDELEEFTKYFRTTIIGHVNHQEDGEGLGFPQNPVFPALVPGVEFVCAQVGVIAKQFWAPRVTP
jgi:hypothetical protein